MVSAPQIYGREERLAVTPTIDDIKGMIADSIDVKQQILDSAPIVESVMDVALLVTNALRNGNRIFFAGNGGSAADAQHLAAEFVSRFAFDRPGLPSLSLSTDTSMITAISNDYGYDLLFRRQLEAQAKPGDVFIGITTSGRSKNVIEALKACPDLGVHRVCMCGANGVIGADCERVIQVPSTSTARIQEGHIMIGHIICGFAEDAIFSNLKPS